MAIHAEPSDALTPFGPVSLRFGAVITFSGEQLVVTADRIVDAIESTLVGASSAGDGRDQWLLSDVPALSRDVAWIIPLSWEPPSSDGDPMRDRATQLWSEIRGACEHRHGLQIGIDLSPDREFGGSYAAELARTGARRADWWAFGDRAVVLVVYGPPLPGLKTLMALHVVPRNWVWDDSTRDKATAMNLRTGDLSWSWADVVRLGSQKAQGLADNLTEADEEGQDS
ncbi:hypothetical protein [Microbacterium sp. A84]|uniref:hypothetical protein n=1 Tax=Microbacterium sp. A84 TaxID=3450715 RepID=UPI003F41DF17